VRPSDQIRVDADGIPWQNEASSNMRHGGPGMSEPKKDSSKEGTREPEASTGSKQSGRNKPARGSSTGAGLAAAALVLAVVAGAGAGWSIWQLTQVQQVQSDLRNDIRRVGLLSDRQEKLIAAADRQEQLLYDLESSLDNGLSIVPDLSMRIRRAEKQLDEIPGVNVQRRSDWLRKEALYYLRVANTQAILAGDAQVATSALQLADEKLLDAGDPDLTPVRGQISQDLAALKAVPVIDRTGLAFQIQSLADQAPNWLFRKTAPEQFEPEISVPDSSAEVLTPWQRFVATVREVLGNIVSIKQTDAPPTAQLAAADEVLITETVRAELQIARLSLISCDNELFVQSLSRVKRLVETFYAPETSAVAAAGDTLDQLLAVELPGALPDISGSLAMMLELEGEKTPERALAPVAPAEPEPEPSEASEPKPKPKPKPKPESTPAVPAPADEGTEEAPEKAGEPT